MDVTAAVPAGWQVGLSLPYPAAGLHDLVAEQAARTPGATAVRQWAEQLTYGELVTAAGRLAAALHRHGAGVESRVIVCTARRPHIVTAVLGVLMAGAAYVPLDPAQPSRRREMLIADAGASVAVVDDAGGAALAGAELTLVPVESELDGQSGPLALPPSSVTRSDNGAYVLFTSGSTGRPKGVVVSHRSAVEFCTAAVELCRIGPGDRSIAYSALGFDVSLLDIFPVLFRGGAVQLASEVDRSDPARLQRFLVEHRITVGYLPPALLPLLEPDQLTDLRTLVVGGEASGPEQVARWSAGGARFLNWYGPTEATVSVTGTELTGQWSRPLPIGRPLPNHRCHVLDDDLLPVPPGRPGELYVSGPGLARGYLDRPGATAEKFMPDPFAEHAGERMYRTGDLVTWEPDGQIAFLGRRDTQFKIAGQRVEAGEIETVLRAHPGVGHAVVDLSTSRAGSPELVAYLTPATAPDLAAVRDFCADRLPSYMRPHRVVRLDKLPLNPSSKVDLAALRAMPLSDVDATAGPAGRVPVTPAQRAVASVWARAFGTAEPTLEEDFFAAGGHSLLAMRLVAALRADEGRDVAADDVFLGRTVEGMAERLEKAEPLDVAGVTVGRPPALSAAQRRLWFLDRLAPGTAAYNIAVAERLRGPLDVVALRTALGMVAARQDILRWRVQDRGGAPYVVVDPPADVPLPVDDLRGAGAAEVATGEPESDGVLAAALRNEAGRPLDLARGPLWRARLLRLGPDDHVLALTLHHLIFDGWSLDVLYRELTACYLAPRDGVPPQLSTSAARYADYVGWLAEQQDRHGRSDLDWWLTTLDGAGTVLDLPRDRPRPPVQTHRGADRRAAVTTVDAARVRALAAELATTPYSVLLAGFAALLRRLTGSTDLIVGVPAADRRHPAFDELVGMFVDVVPVRLRVDDGQDFANLAGRCRDAVLAAMGHRDAPFERVVDGLRLPRDLSRGPLVQVVFNMYNFAAAWLDLPGVASQPLTPGLPGSLYDFTLYLTERDDRFALQAVYNPDLYAAARVDALLRSYVALLGALVRSPAEPVGAASARPPGLPLPDPASPRPVVLARPSAGVLERIDRVVAARPDSVAVAGGGLRLTYAELDRLQNAVAYAVRTAGAAGPGDAVGVLASRSAWLPAVLLGVLRSGSRWLVLDPTYPADRLRRLAEAAGVRLLCRCPGVDVPEPLSGLPVLDVSTLDTSVPEVALGGDRGYLMSTSGTTGEPAVVVTPERPLASFLDWYASRFALGPGDATALLAGLSHDPLLREAFAPLACGGRVCVPEPDWLRDPGRLVSWLDSAGVTVLHLTPQLARLLGAAPGTLPGVRLAVLAGDQLDHRDVAPLRRLLPAALVVNGYGTTETPQLQALHVVEPAGAGLAAAAGHPVPIGRGAPGTDLVVAGSGGPATVGELGEVLVRGPNLAAGYLDPALTARRFGANPYTGDEEDRVYRTGDIGRYNPDGTVVLSGRADDQVKVRGHRVELAEVAAALSSHPDVTTAAAVARELAGETAVIGYAVPRRAGVPPDALREHVRRRLPEHACPAAVVVVPELPLTPNGKLDQAALPAPAFGPSTVDPGSAPLTRTEQLVAGVWREVLRLPRVSVSDNFFDVGGHSLALVAVQARLAAACARPVRVVDLFRFPTVRSLASFLDDGSAAPGLRRAERRLAARRDRAGTQPRHRRDPATATAFDSRADDPTRQM